MLKDHPTHEYLNGILKELVSDLESGAICPEDLGEDLVHSFMKSLDRKKVIIPTFSGLKLNILSPLDRDISIEDIAISLSRECRFAGHTKKFYSVAQHSLHVSEILPHSLALEGLLHDATEAYLRDIASPFKELLPEYRRIERLLDGAIRKKFGLPLEMDREVDLADRVLLATEKRDLMEGCRDEWPVLHGITPLPFEIVPLPEEKAFDAFMQRFSVLSSHD